MIQIEDIVLRDGETGLGFFSRVASHYRMSLRQFCAYKGVILERLAIGNVGAVERISAQWKLDPAAVLAHLPRRTSTHIQIGGELDLYDDFDWRILRYCPTCLAADIESGQGKPRTRPYQRTAWTSPYVFQCVEHGDDLVALETVARGEGDFTAAVVPMLDGVGGAPERRTCRAPDEADVYFSGRTQPIALGKGFLDAIPTFAVAQLCEAFAQAGMVGRPKTDRRYLLSVGYRVLKDGPSSITPFLDELLAQRPRGHQRRPTDVYGTMGGFLRDRPAKKEYFQPIKDIVAAHAFKNLPMSLGETFLGQLPPRRTQHTIRTAAAQYRMHKKTVARHLFNNGVIETLGGLEGVTFDAALVDAILSKEAEVKLTPKDVANKFQMPEAVVFDLVERGVFIKRGRPNLGQLWIDGTQVAWGKLAARMSRAEGTELTPIEDAAKESGAGLADLLSEVLEGTLQAFFIRQPVMTVADIMVRMSDIPRRPTKVKKKPGSRPVDGYLSFSKAVEHLEISPGTLRTLLSMHRLSYVKLYGRAKHLQVRELDRFKSSLIGYTEIKRLTGMTPLRIRYVLDGKGIKPAIKDDETDVRGFAFFDRGQVSDIFDLGRQE